jgi:uncharacterized membrane protein
VLAGLLAGAAGWLGRRALARVPLWLAPLLALAATGSYVLVMSTLSLQRHAALKSNAYDLAIFDQAIFNTAFGRPFAVSIKTDDLTNPILLGDHFSPALALLAPLTWVWNDVRALLLAQSLLLAAGALPLYRLAREQTKSALLPPALVLAYLLSPTLQHTNLYDFHEVALATPALAFAAAALVRRRWGALLAWLGLALLCKEEIAFVSAGFGALLVVRGLGRLPAGWAAARQEVLLGSSILVVALGWAWLTITVLIPWFEGSGAYTYTPRYADLGSSPEEIVRTVLTRPEVVGALMLQPAKLQFVASFLAPFAFLPVLAAELLLLTLPTFGYLLLSSYPAQYTLGRQYGVVVVPLVAIAAAVAASRGERLLGRWGNAAPALALALVAASLLTYHQFGPGPFGGWYDPERYQRAPRVATAERLFRQIPPQASVSAQENLAPHLSRRERLYLFPALHGAEYVILDNEGGTFPVDRADWDREVRELLRNPLYRLLTAEDGFALFQRQDLLPGQPTDLRFGSALRLAAVVVEPGSLGLVWELIARPPASPGGDGYRQVVRLRREDGSLALEVVRPPRPGSGLFESGRGVVGERIWERFDLPGDLAPGPYWLDLQLLAEPSGMPLPRSGALPQLSLP